MLDAGILIMVKKVIFMTSQLNMGSYPMYVLPHNVHLNYFGQVDK